MSNKSAVLRAIDFICCLLVCVTLVYTVQGAFNISDGVHKNFLLNIAVCFVLLSILFFELYKPSRKIVTRAGYVILCLAACFCAIFLSTEKNPIADVEQNYFVTAAIFAVVCAIVFAFSRKHTTSIILFTLGSFTCAYVQLMYVRNMLAASAVFVFFALVLIILSNYQKSIDKAYIKKTPALGAASFASFLLPFVSCVIACVVVIGVIMPLNPPHATIKLMTVYLAYEEIPVTNAVQLSENADKTITSSNTTNEVRKTTDKKVDKNASSGASSGTAENSGTKKDYLSGEYSDIDFSSLLSGARAVTMRANIPWLLLILACIIVIFALVALIRYLVYRIRFKKICAYSFDEQVVRFYMFFLSRFAKLKMAKPNSLTPVEYANLYRERLYPFVGAQTQGSFDHLTALLVFTQFKGDKLNKADLEPIYTLYRNFYPACKRKLGAFKLFFRYVFL